MGFSDPTDPEYFEIKKFVGSLAIIAVNEYIPNFSTAMGQGPAVKAEVAIIDGPGEGARFPDAMFFGKKIVPQLKASVGSVLLGRITQGAARPGQSAPYQLAKASVEDAALANKWVAANGDIEPQVDTHSASGQRYAPDNGHPPPPPPQNYGPANGASAYPTTRTYASTAGEEPPF